MISTTKVGERGNWMRSLTLFKAEQQRDQPKLAN